MPFLLEKSILVASTNEFEELVKEAHTEGEFVMIVTTLEQLYFGILVSSTDMGALREGGLVLLR